MTLHYHVQTGISGYGPDSDENTYTSESVRETADAIRWELDNAIDANVQTANLAGERGYYEEAWEAHKLAETLETLRANLSNDRADAPLYRDDPAAWDTTLARLIAETFPLDIIEPSTRLYVWTCGEEDCLTDDHDVTA